MFGILKSRLAVAIVSATLTASVVGGIAWAAQSPVDGNGVIHGCYNPSTGVVKLRVNATCPVKGATTPISWNQQGPEGPPGAQGDPGVSATGVAQTAAVGYPSAIAFDGTSIWVAERTRGTAAQVDPSSMQVMSRVDVEGSPSSLRADGSSVWVQAGNRLTKIGSFTVNGGSATPLDGLEFTSEGTWAVAVANGTTRLFLFDAANGSVLRQFPIPNGVLAFEVVGNTIWVASDPLTRYDATTGSFLGTTAAGFANPLALDYDGASLWLASDPYRGVLQRIDPVTANVTSTIEVGSNINSILVVGDSVWVAHGPSESITEVDRLTGNVIRTVFVGQGVVALTTDGFDLYAALEGGLVAKIRTEA